MCNLETTKLTLRKTNANDWESYYELNSNAEVLRYCFDVPPIEEIRKEFETRIQPWDLSSKHWLSLTIFEKQSANFVGMIGLRQNGSGFEVGFLFLQAFQGMGYGTESLKVLKEHAISLGVKELIARIIKGNEFSVRLVRKLGFKLYAERQNVVRINGYEHDGLIYKWTEE